MQFKKVLFYICGMELTKRHGNTKYHFGEMVIGKVEKFNCNPYSMKTALRAYNAKNGTAIKVEYRVTDRGSCEIWRTE